MKLKRLFILLTLCFFLASITKRLAAQICDDWKSQSTSYVVTGSTPNDPDHYIWEEKPNTIQGVHLCVLNADVIPIYIQQNNNYINFTSRFSPSAALLFMVKLEVNLDDGGFATVYSGSAKQDIVWYGSSAALANPGDHNLKVRVTFFDGTIRYREYHVKMVPPSQKLYKDNAGNTLRKWEGNDPNGLNAIVFSEGFDAYNTNGQEMYFHAAADLIECFRNNGYDVFLLDNYFGTQDIRNNAAVFASAVNYISYIYGQELIVAGGVSMGGIISRYALAKAEEQNDPLPVHTFIAIDSPHQGAIISEPLQNFKKANEADDEFAKHALSNSAARQLLMYNAYDPNGGVHQTFFNELNSLNGDGYPHLTRNIGVSFSTDDPNPNSGGWYKITYHTGPFNGTVKTFDLTNAEKLAGSWLPKDLTTMSPIIKQASYWWLQLLVPGITPLYYPTISFERFTDPTYIPYYSALDIRNGNTMFDVCIEPEGTSWHDVLPEDILEEIVNHVILTDEYFQHKNVIGQWSLRGKKIVAGNYVTTLLPQGDVKVWPGGELDMLASEIIMLRPGFQATYGARVNIVVDPDLSYECLDKANDAGPEKAQARYDKVLINKKLPGELEVMLYPNPAHDMVHLQIPPEQASDLSIDIYDSFSKLVWSRSIQGGEKSEIYVGHLKRGAYIMKVSNGFQSKTCKLIKI